MEKLIDREIVIRLVRSITGEVFSTMLSLDALAEEAYTEAQHGKADGVVSFVGLASPGCVGTGSLQCSADTACYLASQFLMTEFSSIDDEVLDAFGELTNMIIGNLKTALEDHLGPMGLSIPTVVYGKNFSTRSPGNEEWTVLPFSWGNGKLYVRVCLKSKENNQSRGAEKRDFVLQN